MERRKFMYRCGLGVAAFLTGKGLVMKKADLEPEAFYFEDDGEIPNSKYPLLVYHGVFKETGSKAADWLEQQFGSNNWTNTWRWGVYPFHHYHSNTHEVLGVFSGSALLHLGGEKGKKINVQVGDVIVIPAGVGHKCISHSADFTVVGAYPNGLSPDLNRGEKGERPQTDKNIAAVVFPATDPLLGGNGGLRIVWKLSKPKK